MRKIFVTLTIVSAIVLFNSNKSIAQTAELFDLLESTEENTEDFTSSSFKSTRLLYGHSVETRPNGVLEFIVSHRFGRISDGVSTLFGLDNSNIRIALEYGIADRLNIGFGRSSFDQSLDGFVKYKILRQSNFKPVSIVAFASTVIDTGELFNRPTIDNNDIDFNFRLSYTYQLLIARKFTSDLSLQLSPTVVHRNLAPGSEDNDVFVLGIGGRYKLTNRLALDIEYFYQFRDLPINEIEPALNITNSLSVGIEIETGGHVFQLVVSNSAQQIEKGFLTETTGDFFSGDLFYGFNISRVFDLRPKTRSL